MTIPSVPAPTAPTPNALTIDVEDYFQVQAFTGVVQREAWETYPRRVEANTDRLLGQFARAGVHGTFFTLGWVADRHPALVRRIVAAGHELASHGYWHGRADQQDEATFRDDVRRAKHALEDAGGVAVDGYRAPTFSIGPRNAWAFDVLQSEGYRYSSSIYPIRHDLYGTPDAPRFPHHPTASADNLWEIPMTTVRALGRNLPVAGGGYFRLLPYPVYRLGLRRFARDEAKPGVFYLHPWEIDPGQPRIPGIGRMSRFRHYVSLGATEARLDRLLRDFAWDRMDRVFGDLLAPRPPAVA